MHASANHHPGRPWLSLLVNLCLAASAFAQGTPEQGFRLMSAQASGNCLACHSVPGMNGSNSSFGPSLQKVAQRYSSSELRQWVTDARQIKPDTLMPPLGTTVGTLRPIRAQAILSPEDIGHIVAALETLK